MRTLLGSWEGAWGGRGPARLVVETVGPTSATVRYSVAATGTGEGVHAAGSRRWEAPILALHGTHSTDGVVGSRIVMRRSPG